MSTVKVWEGFVFEIREGVGLGGFMEAVEYDLVSLMLGFAMPLEFLMFRY